LHSYYVVRSVLILLLLQIAFISQIRADDLDELINMPDTDYDSHDSEDGDTAREEPIEEVNRTPTATDMNFVSAPSNTSHLISIPPPAVVDEPAKIAEPKKLPTKQKKSDGLSKENNVTIFFENDQKEIDRQKYEKKKLKEFYEMERKKKKSKARPRYTNRR